MSRSRNTLLRLLHSFGKKVPKYPAILCLDERILQKIYQHLSLVDQVCLSLSCKELYGLFGTIVKHKDLEFPRLLRIRNPILCVNSQDVPRNQLLLRLENRRWAYCARCLKLHPRKEFTRHFLRKSPLERPCTYYSGIADLCPCISLTIRGREQLIKIIKQPAKPAKTRYGPFVYDFDDRGQPGLGHVCEFSTRSGYVVRVALVLVITETGQLCAAARHTLRFSFPGAHFTAEPTFACPHEELLHLVPGNQAVENPHMYQALMASKPHRDILPFVPGRLVSKTCMVCPTLITKYPLSEDKNLAAFWVVRNLGSCKWPADCPWIDQCRLTGIFFKHYDTYWWAYERIREERRAITEIFPYRLRSQNLQNMMQGVYGQWKRDYCLEQKRKLRRRLLQYQRQYSRTAGDGTLPPDITTLLFLTSGCWRKNKTWCAFRDRSSLFTGEDWP